MLIEMMLYGGLSILTGLSGMGFFTGIYKLD